MSTKYDPELFKNQRPSEIVYQQIKENLGDKHQGFVDDLEQTLFEPNVSEEDSHPGSGPGIVI